MMNKPLPCHLHRNVLITIKEIPPERSIISPDAMISAKVTHWFQGASSTLGLLKAQVNANMNLTVAANVTVSKVIILLLLLYSCETWTTYVGILSSLTSYTSEN